MLHIIHNQNPSNLTRLITLLKLHTKPHFQKHDNNEQSPNSQHERLHLHKSKGQHLLVNQRVLDAIVRNSNVQETDTVLEIGPGTGNLTVKLLEVARKVVAVEVDKRMVEVVRKRVAQLGFQEKFDVIYKDALKAEFPQFDLVVANIPYGISSPLVAKLVYGGNSFRSATLLLQKEFARRLLAKPGNSEFNRLAVNVSLLADVEFVMDVSKREFLPCPKVDSSVVIIRPKADIPDVNTEEWLAFTRTCFSKKNKTLGATFKQKKKVMELWRLSELSGGSDRENSVHSLEYKDNDDDDDNEEESDNESCSSPSCLVTGASLFKEKIVGVLRSGGFEDKRPSKLTNEDLLHLLSLLNRAGVYFHDRTGSRNANSTSVLNLD